MWLFRLGNDAKVRRLRSELGLTRKRRATRLPCGTYAFRVEGGMAGQSEVPTRPMFGLIDRSSFVAKVRKLRQLPLCNKLE